MFGSHCVQASCYFLSGHLATGQAKPYRGCADAAAVKSPQILYHARAHSVQRPHRDGAVIVRGPYDHRTFFRPK